MRRPHAGAMLLLAACSTASTMRIQTEQNPSVDLTRYTTYAWASPARSGGAPARSGRELLDWRIRTAVDEQLARLGYARAGAGQPDLLVDYHVDTREMELEEGPGAYLRYRAEGGEGEWGSAWVGGYEEGSLVVEVLDSRTRRLVWRGSATAVVNPDLQQQRVPEAVRRILERFPPRGGAASAGAPLTA